LGATFFFFSCEHFDRVWWRVDFFPSSMKHVFFSHFLLYRFIFLFEKISHKCRNENIL
jgi:hypothetical protein